MMECRLCIFDKTIRSIMNIFFSPYLSDKHIIQELEYVPLHVLIKQFTIIPALKSFASILLPLFITSLFHL